MNTKLPPEYKFKSQPPKNVIPLENWMVSKLFWIAKEIVVNDKGEIVFHFNKIRYAYQIYNPADFFKYKNSLIRVRFNVDDKTMAHLYERETDMFISVIEEKAVWTKEHPEVFYKHVGRVKKITNHIKNERLRDKSLIGLFDRNLQDSKESMVNSNVIKRLLDSKKLN
jgi:hypothetical protein